MPDLGPTADLARVRRLLDEISTAVDDGGADLARLRPPLDEIIAVVDEIIVERGLTAESLAEAAEDDLWRDTATISQLFNISGDTVRDLCENQGMGKKCGGRWLGYLPAFQEWQQRREAKLMATLLRESAPNGREPTPNGRKSDGTLPFAPRSCGRP